ncbi:rac GTPase-activating protein 1 [Sphaeramia orbicularis]|uniref:rac GTPase-activating protein 1 n=1 Tax=Sphaeramia orbicularis TaxID=375764 RepID=UPI00117F5FA4|nr:rac GTPase-activating protein 1-like [Sphaeramia orbicularis]
MSEECGLLVEELLTLCIHRMSVEQNTISSELEFMEVVKNFEAIRKRCVHAELELKKYKELLVKSDVSKAALEVKLKHARNQLEVEMKKRYKIEGDYQYMQRQMQLICDILIHDTKSSACLNDEQKSLLATFERKGGNATMQRSSKRLSVIDESSFLSHSDISYDRTDDDMDLDTSVIKPLRSRARERRRSSMGISVSAPMGKRSRGGNISAELLDRKPLEEKVETIMKASVVTPDPRGQIHMVVDIAQESPENPTLKPQTVTQECGLSVGEAGQDQTSVWFGCNETTMEPELESKMEENVNRTERMTKHIFLSKTVIRPETCSSCRKRIRFGKMVVKCRNCRLVVHPECKQKCVDGCAAGRTAATGPTSSLDGFAPVDPPRVPLLVVECVAEIERRGLKERGLYRVPGTERLVKELRERFVQGKAPLMLSRVEDVHVICGVLKDFLRKLKEPLVTFRLHPAFMEASETPDEENAASMLYQTISELPKANRDTMAFLMLHLYKVMRSPQCQMDQNNLARIFGPTIVGHGLPEPSPSTIMRDTNLQPKVVRRLLSLPEDYWRRVLSIQSDRITPSSSTNRMSSRLFKPLTSPELSSYYKETNRGSTSGRFRHLGNTYVTNMQSTRRSYYNFEQIPVEGSSRLPADPLPSQFIKLKNQSDHAILMFVLLQRPLSAPPPTELSLKTGLEVFVSISH